MAAEILNGRAVAKSVRRYVKQEVAKLRREHELVPGLAVVIAGDDVASQTYVNSKQKTCKRLGIHSEVHAVPADVSEEDLVALICRLNSNPDIHGILVQRPLPAGLDVLKVTEVISPEKDVDCFHPQNVGRWLTGGAWIYPCTPLGVIRLLDAECFPFTGAQAVVIGRSAIVGRPVAQMLLDKNCTVMACHSRTRNLPELVREADLVIAAVGKPELVRGDWLKAGAWVVDVGINSTPDGGLVGDVAFEEACRQAARVTPVPGGVGPMTIAMLMENTLMLARRTLEK